MLSDKHVSIYMLASLAHHGIPLESLSAHSLARTGNSMKPRSFSVSRGSCMWYATAVKAPWTYWNDAPRSRIHQFDSSRRPWAA
jgi:hypothetical protein